MIPPVRLLTSIAFLIITLASAIPAAITITEPTSSTRVKVDSTCTIRWTADGTVTSVRIYIQGSLATGVLKKTTAYPRTLIASGVTASVGVYSWHVDTILDNDLSQFQIVIINESDTTIRGLSSYFFLIRGYRNITITSPTPNQELRIGESKTIQWTGANLGNLLSLSLLRTTNNGSYNITNVYKTIDTAVPNTNSYTWRVTDSTGTDQLTSRQILALRLTSRSYSNTMSQMQQVILTQPPTLTITLPNATSIWYRDRDSTYNISIPTQGIIDSIGIYLQKGGVNTDTIARSIMSTSPKLWRVPINKSIGNDYTIKVVKLNEPAITATSQPFTITDTKSIVPSSPQSGDFLYQKNTYSVRWTSTGTIDSVALTVIKTTDTTWRRRIAPRVINNGSYSVKFDSTFLQGTYKIRIHNLADSAIFGTTDVFTIKSALSITPVAPSAGALLYRDSTYTLRWNSTSDITSASLYLLSSSGVKIATIQVSASAGSYVWRIPAAIPLDTGYQIKIVADMDTSIYTTILGIKISTPAAQNRPPIIGNLPTQQSVMAIGDSLDIPFLISDPDLPSLQPVCTAKSKNLSIIVDSDLSVTGATSNRVLKIRRTLAAGIDTITIKAVDEFSAADSKTVVIRVVTKTAPVISGLKDTTILISATPLTLAFAVRDNETPSGALSVSLVSNNQTLLPTSAITLSGTDSLRSMRLAPTGVGTVIISATVKDSAESTTVAFTLRIRKNAPPQMAPIANQTVVMNSTSAIRVAFAVADSESAPTTLTIHTTSSNSGYIGAQSLLVKGPTATGACTLTVILPTNKIDSTIITLTAVDGTDSTTQSFMIKSVQNTAPAISMIDNQTIRLPSSAALRLGFSISDNENPADSLKLTIRTSVPDAIPAAAITLERNGTACQAVVNTQLIRSGASIITIVVKDESDSAATRFFLTAFNPADTATVSAGAYNLPLRDLIWRPVGWSYNPASTHPIDVLGLGPVDTKKWKLAKWDNTSRDYIFLNANNPDIFTFKSGTMYWLINRQGRSLASSTGTSRICDTTWSQTIPQNGWGDFTLPFAIDSGVSFNAIVTASQLLPSQIDIWEWTDSTRTSVSNPATGAIADTSRCRPGHHYSVHNRTDQQLLLTIPPLKASGATGLGRWKSQEQRADVWHATVVVTDIRNRIATELSCGILGDQSDSDRMMPSPPSPGILKAAFIVADRTETIAHLYRKRLDGNQFLLKISNTGSDDIQTQMSCMDVDGLDPNMQIRIWNNRDRVWQSIGETSSSVNIAPSSTRLFTVLSATAEDFRLFEAAALKYRGIAIKQQRGKVFFTHNDPAVRLLRIQIIDLTGRTIFKHNGFNQVAWSTAHTSSANRIVIARIHAEFDDGRAMTNESRQFMILR